MAAMHDSNTLQQRVDVIELYDNFKCSVATGVKIDDDRIWTDPDDDDDEPTEIISRINAVCEIIIQGNRVCLVAKNNEHSVLYYVFVGDASKCFAVDVIDEIGQDRIIPRVTIIDP